MQTAVAANAPLTPDITPRDIDFALDNSRAANWLDNSREKTIFNNALSTMFPAGERFFIAAVARHRQKVTDPKLLADVKAFVQQEGFHTREHIAYNEALASIVDIDKLDREFHDYLNWIKTSFPPLASLLVTVALEHFTALLAEETLRHPEHLAGADPEFARLWRWHALEELEHKAVAFDVFRAATRGKREWRRVLLMPVVTFEFYRFIGKSSFALMKAQGLHANPLAWAKYLWYVFGYPGMMRRITRKYLRYFSPAFHPNDIDDREPLAAGRAYVASLA